MYRDTERESFDHDTPRSVLIERQPVRRSIEDTTQLREPPVAPGELISTPADWRTTLAGTLTALTVLLFMGLLGLGVALTQFNAATAANEGALPAGLGRNVGIWTAISLLLAFLIGGFVAARRESVSARPEHGALRGSFTFLLASPLLMWVLLGGLVGAASALTGTIAGLHMDPSTQARLNPTAVGDMAGHLRDATWGTLFGCLLGLVGSALGGMLAVRRTETHSGRVRPTTDVRVRR